MNAAARVTAISGGGGAAAAARVTGCRLGLGRLRGRDELVGQDGIEKWKILASSTLCPQHLPHRGGLCGRSREDTLKAQVFVFSPACSVFNTRQHSAS